MRYLSPNLLRAQILPAATERHWEDTEMNGPLEIVLEYIDRHWAPIPVPFKEKKPRITAWQKQRITRETAGQYFIGLSSDQHRAG